MSWLGSVVESLREPQFAPEARFDHGEPIPETNGTQAKIRDCNDGQNQAWTYTSRQRFVVYGNKCQRVQPGHRQRHQGPDLGVQRAEQPEVEHQLGRDHHERQRRVVPVRVQRDDEQRDVAGAVDLQRRDQPAVESELIW